jgi:cytochrome c peroxidase
MNGIRVFVSLTGLLLLALVIGPGQADENRGTARPARRTLQLPDPPYRYTGLDLPAHFKTREVRRLDNTPLDNPVTDAGATLGRVLFYDTRLSANNTIACASCHQQQHAFSDARRFSTGFEGKVVDRNAMSLVDLRYYVRGRFFWDERAASLEEQVLLPIQNRIEMGQDLPGLVERLAKEADYPELFRKAFGTPQITQQRLAQALAQFVRSLVSSQSKYDEGMARASSLRADFANFTAQENHGKTLFLRHCAVCHLPAGQGAVFSPATLANTGLDANEKAADGGVGDVTLNRFQIGQFKSPSLRNVEFTAPYMHDGRFATLEDVIDHYSKGVRLHPNLDPRLRGPRRRLDLDETEKAALVAFLKTLSDRKFITDPKFSDPFR